MTVTDLQLCARVQDLVDAVTVLPGGLTAITAGEVYEDDNASSVSRILGSVLYQTLHNGRDKPIDFAMRSFRDPVFEAALVRSTPDLRREVRAAVLDRRDDHCIVELDGVRVRAPRSEHAPGQHPEDGRMSVELPCLRPGLSPGFLYLTSTRTATLSGPVLRLYAHLDDPSAAVPVWSATIGTLQDLGINWHAKVLSNRALYPRNDAVVVYLQRDGWRHARSIAQALEGTGVLAPGTSPFTRPITASVGCGFEPTDRRGANKGLSFGQHRANIFAQALIAHATLDDPAGEPVGHSLYAAFLDAGIDPAEPARNLSSPAVDVLGIN